MGGWDRAKEEATAKATQFCERSGQQLALRDEQRSGSSFPGAPQKSTITFACVPDSSSTGEAAVATPPHATAGGLKKTSRAITTPATRWFSTRSAWRPSKSALTGSSLIRTVTSHACRRRVSLPKRSGGELQARFGEIDLAVSVARHFSGVHCHGFGICCYAEWL